MASFTWDLPKNPIDVLSALASAKAEANEARIVEALLKEGALANRFSSKYAPEALPKERALGPSVEDAEAIPGSKGVEVIPEPDAVSMASPTVKSPEKEARQAAEMLLARDLAKAQAQRRPAPYLSKEESEADARATQEALDAAGYPIEPPIDLEDDRRREAAETMAWDIAKAQAQRRSPIVTSAEDSEADAAALVTAAQQIDPSSPRNLSRSDILNAAEVPDMPEYPGRYNDLEHLKALEAASDPLANLTVDELVNMTLRGKFGNGDARRETLGKRYDAVQRALNNLLQKNKGSKSTRNQVF